MKIITLIVVLTLLTVAAVKASIDVTFWKDSTEFWKKEAKASTAQTERCIEAFKKSTDDWAAAVERLTDGR
jgi:glycerol kinase